MRRRRRGFALAAVLLMLAGCASSGSAEQPATTTAKTATAPAAAAKHHATPSASLTVSYSPHGNQGPTRVWRLRCRPAGGSHPHPAAACRELAAHAGLLGPPSHPCTRGTLQLGAPQTQVSGRLSGRRIQRLVRPACDPAAWSALHVLLRGS